MHDIDEIIKKIDELKASLAKLKKGRNFSDEEVVSMSQMLDGVLNEYYKLVKQKVDKE
jgi:hypothetical protein